MEVVSAIAVSEARFTVIQLALHSLRFRSRLFDLRSGVGQKGKGSDVGFDDKFSVSESWEPELSG
jgi:hypothetical protein